MEAIINLGELKNDIKTLHFLGIEGSTKFFSD